LTPYLIVGLVAGVITYVMTPVVRWFSIRIGAIDRPSDRKVHANPTPTLGGLAIFFGLLGAGLVARTMPEFKEMFTQTSEIAGIFAGALVIFLLGVVDDMRDLPAPVKLAGQVFAAGIVFLSGVKFQFVPLPDTVLSLSDDVSVLVTVIWLVAMINAVNLVDGLDGLAAGIVAIAGASFFVYMYRLIGEGGLGIVTAAPLISIIVVGATLGFLRHNFYPARIFMGDSGAMLLGLVLGAATVAGIGRALDPSTLIDASATDASNIFLAYFPLLIPLSVLAIPLLDSVFAIIRRARRRRSVFHADKEHLHHRLMDLGHGHKKAVVVMYLWSALAAGAGLGFSFLHSNQVVYALPVAVGAIVLYTLFPVLTKAIQDRITP
jgi:UDP-GlcNAc:undecaprenyl-phosphate/decaprenyl-phosphate GlcNAc-1-phosphate transferase